MSKIDERQLLYIFLLLKSVKYLTERELAIDKVTVRELQRRINNMEDVIEYIKNLRNSLMILQKEEQWIYLLEPTMYNNISEILNVIDQMQGQRLITFLRQQAISFEKEKKNPGY